MNLGFSTLSESSTTCMLNRLSLLLLFAVCLAGCSRQPLHEKEADKRTAREPITVNTQAPRPIPLIWQPPDTHGSKATGTNRFRLLEMPANKVIDLWLHEQLKRYPDVRASMGESRGELALDIIGEKDMEAIETILTGIHDFLPLDSVGTLSRFNELLLVTVPGSKGDTNFNANLIRVPSGKWMLLTVEQVP